MKKFLISTIILTSLFSIATTVKASTVTDEILKKMPNVTEIELNNSIKETANMLGKSEEEISKQILSELKKQETLSLNEKNTNRTKRSTGSISSYSSLTPSTFTLDAGRASGDIFYEPASTVFVEHGHVGIYWTSNIVVESIQSGVRSIDRSEKKVEKGSKIFTLLDVSKDIKDKASDWAYSKIGDSYSFNFATNRLTSHDGDKNCSKLVWSSYMVAGNLDIDSDGGLGVYPKDILNYSKSSVYKSY